MSFDCLYNCHLDICFCETLNGKARLLEVKLSNIVLDVKKMIEDLDGIFREAQWLIYGKVLENDRTLGDYNVNNESTISLKSQLIKFIFVVVF